MKIKKLLTPILASTALAHSSYAAIVLVDDINTSDITDASSYTGIDASALITTGASKIVVTIATEGASGVGNIWNSITFDGNAMTQAATTNGATGRADIWFLDLEGITLTGSSINLTAAGAQTGYVLGAFTLSGTANGFSNLSLHPGSDNAPIPHTTLTDGEFVVAAIGRNLADSGTIFQTPLTQAYYYTALGSSGAGRFTGGAGYELAGAAGLTNYTITNGGSTGGIAVVSFADAAAVPEPSSMALLGLGGLALILRRRH